MKPRPDIRTSAGFTLIELLVSSAVLGIVMFILLSTLGSALSMWRNTEAAISADREGRSANLLLAQDLANAVVPTNTAMWPQVVNGTILRFLTKRPPGYQSSSSVGDLCFVEYQVADDPDSGDGDFLALTRNFVNSADTYAAYRAGRFPDPDPGRAQVLAANIVPNRRVLPFNNEVSDAYFTLLGTNALPLGTGQRPAIVDVTISTADEGSVRTLDITNKQLQGSGYFSFRVALPRSQ
jgi:prepilin-type N-terminal cleavage/methylation domain-containing protein